MFKMKSLLCIVALFSFALVSCTERIPEKAMPEWESNGAITMVNATVEPLQLKGLTGTGIFSWSEEHSIGIYGTAKGSNECYIPVKTTVGDNEANFFGNEVGGDLVFYMPYQSGGSVAANSGRVTVPVEQKFYADPFDHLMYNTTLLASGTTGDVSFGFYSGLIKIELKHDIQNITSVLLRVGNFSTEVNYSNNLVGDIAIDDDVEDTVTNGHTELVITGFPEGTNSTVGKPLTVWAAVAPGEYENLIVEVANAEYTIASPVLGPFFVEECAVADKVCVAEKVDHNNGVGDFEGESGEFNPTK